MGLQDSIQKAYEDKQREEFAEDGDKQGKLALLRLHLRQDFEAELGAEAVAELTPQYTVDLQPGQPEEVHFKYAGVTWTVVRRGSRLAGYSWLFYNSGAHDRKSVVVGSLSKELLSAMRKREIVYLEAVERKRVAEEEERKRRQQQEEQRRKTEEARLKKLEEMRVVDREIQQYIATSVAQQLAATWKWPTNKTVTYYQAMIPIAYLPDQEQADMLYGWTRTTTLVDGCIHLEAYYEDWTDRPYKARVIQPAYPVTYEKFTASSIDDLPPALKKSVSAKFPGIGKQNFYGEDLYIYCGESYTYEVFLTELPIPWIRDLLNN